MPQAPPLLGLLSVFNAQPGATLLLSPDWVIVAASDDYLAATQTHRERLVGQFIFDAFPDNPEAPEANAVANVRASLTQVMATRQPHDMAPQHYDVPDQLRPGQFLERYWKPRHTPVLDAAGQVQFIIQSVQDITASRVAERALQESRAREEQARAAAETERQRLHGVLMQLPLPLMLLQGATQVVELINPQCQQLFPRRRIQGLPLHEGLPELAGQGFFEALDHVYRTGEPFQIPEAESWADFGDTGQLQLRYYHSWFLPFRDAQGQVIGVLNPGVDVTEQVLARQRVQQLNDELEARVQQRTQELETARAEVEEQRNRLLRLFGQAPAHINLFTGPDLVWTLVHPDTQRVVPERQLLGQPRRQTLPEFPEAQHALFERVYRTGEAVHLLEEPRRLDLHGNGEWLEEFFDMSVLPTYNAAGQIEGVMSFAVNVTERVRGRQRADALQAEMLAAARQQAQEREALYNILAETPAAVAFLRGPQHRFDYVNTAYQQLFPERRLTGQTVAEALPEAREAGFLTELDRVYRTGNTFFGQELPMRVQPQDGRPARQVFYTFTYQAYREAGQVAGLSIFAFDVTEQVLARRERETERQRLLSLFEEAPAGICILAGPDMVFEFVNPVYQRLLLGRALLGRPVLEALPEFVGNPVTDLLHRVYATGRTQEEQALLIPVARAADGVLEQRYFTFICQPRHNEQAEVDGVLVFVFEVTEQVRSRQQAQGLAAELTATNELLTRTNADLDNFIYTASHDLKAPIANIEGLLYLLQEELPTAVVHDTEVGPTLTRMLDAVDRFKRTIEHLTDVSKLQKANAPDATLVNLAAVIDDVRQDLQPQLQAAQVQLLVDVSALPPVQFSEKNLRSVVYNLLSNAVKYRHPNRRPHVDVRAHVRPGYTVLEVHDNGLGIAEYQLPKLFTMFQRFHDHVEGTGIGLYMIKRMVENAGGRLEVHSQLGAGTTFFVFLPQGA